MANLQIYKSAAEPGKHWPRGMAESSPVSSPERACPFSFRVFTYFLTCSDTQTAPSLHPGQNGPVLTKKNFIFQNKTVVQVQKVNFFDSCSSLKFLP